MVWQPILNTLESLSNEVHMDDKSLFNQCYANFLLKLISLRHKPLSSPIANSNYCYYYC